MALGVMNAQTVESSRLFENIYVTAMGGAITTTQYNGDNGFWNGALDVAKNVKPAASLEFGKYVTPVVGFGIEGVALFNTIGTNTFVNQSNVIANAKFNISNLLGGYKGEPRRVEFVLVPGLGWGHDYGYFTNEAGEKIRPSDPDYATYNAALEMNINLGKQKAWQVNIKPVYTINHRGTQDVFVRDNMNGRLMVGLTYKFGSRSKNSHNFVYCPYSVTQSDYDALKAQYDALAAREPEVKEVVKTVTEEKEVIVKEVKNLTGKTFITFTIGSAVLSNVEKAKVAEFANALEDSTKVFIIGSADSKTGSEARNLSLAEKRADVVKDALISNGISADRISTTTQLDAANTPEVSRAAVLTLIAE